jgi:Ca-activated chloride channel family protein
MIGTGTLKIQLAKFLPLFIRTITMISIIIALARPQNVSKGELPPTEGVDIILCIDTSLSMSAIDFSPYNRLDAAKEAANSFIKNRRNDRIGIVVFGGNAILTCPLTWDYQSVLEFLDNVTIGMTQSDGTAIGDAIMTSINHFKDSQAKSKVIVLLTDGRSNTGIITDPVIAAKTAATYDIKIYTIGTASKGRAQMPIDDPVFGKTFAYIDEDLDQATLMAMADATGGEFYRAKNYLELQRIYSKIDSLEKTTFEIKSVTSYNDIYLQYLVFALILLIAIMFLERIFLLILP